MPLLRAAEPRSHRLIRAFSAEAQVEALAEQGFTGAWEHIRESREVRDGAADHGNAG